jgi:hypothetical protein
MRGANIGNGFLWRSGQYSLADSSSRKLFLSETQLPDTSTRLTFIVRDGNGTPIKLNPKSTRHSFSLFRRPMAHIFLLLRIQQGQEGAVSVIS